MKTELIAVCAAQAVGEIMRDTQTRTQSASWMPALMNAATVSWRREASQSEGEAARDVLVPLSLRTDLQTQRNRGRAQRTHRLECLPGASRPTCRKAG